MVLKYIRNMSIQISLVHQSHYSSILCLRHYIHDIDRDRELRSQYRLRVNTINMKTNLHDIIICLFHNLYTKDTSIDNMFITKNKLTYYYIQNIYFFGVWLSQRTITTSSILNRQIENSVSLQANCGLLVKHNFRLEGIRAAGRRPVSDPV